MHFTKKYLIVNEASDNLVILYLNGEGWGNKVGQELLLFLYKAL